MQFRRINLICVVLVTVFVFGCRKKELEPQSEKSFILIPHLENKEPIIAIYIFNGGLPTAFGEEKERLWIILSVWQDGKAIWSKDELNGGPPYFIGEISSQKIEEFFDFIEKKDLFKSNINHKQNYGPDSTYTAIAAVRDSNYFEIGSWHELFEAEPNIAVTSNGVESLDGRTRQEVLSEQPQDYKDFRNIWSQLRQASKKLIPDEGQPAGDIKFELKPVKIDYQLGNP